MRASSVLVVLAPFLVMACGTLLDIGPDGPAVGGEGGIAPAGDGGARSDATPDGGGDPGGDGAPPPCAKDDAGACTGDVVTSSRGLVYSLVVQGAFVYFGSRSGVVGRVDVMGAGYKEYASSLGEVEQIAVDGTHVYIASYSAGVHRTPKEGPPALETVDSCLEARAVAVDGTSAYWLTTGCGSAHLASKDFASGGTATSAALPAADVLATSRDGHLVVDAARVYFASYQRVANLPKSLAGTPTSMSDWYLTQENVNGLALDGNELFVRLAFNVSVLTTTQQASVIATQRDVATTPADVYRAGIATDAMHVYFAATSGREVRRAVKSGTNAVAFAADSSRPLAVALDGAYVYWSNAAGQIRRAPK
jgi:hypothetical protein